VKFEAINSGKLVGCPIRGQGDLLKLSQANLSNFTFRNLPFLLRWDVVPLNVENTGANVMISILWKFSLKILAMVWNFETLA
jgi:hypothetical protein